MFDAPGAPARLGAQDVQMSDLPMLTYVEFRSDKYPAYEGEEEEINPDLWGKRLAEFLCDKLLTEGFKTEGPFAEDWGVRIIVVNEGFSLWIGCGHYREYPDGYLCFIEPHVRYIRRSFGKIDARERIASLQHALDKILVETDGIRAIRWWTHEGLTTRLGKVPRLNVLYVPVFGMWCYSFDMRGEQVRLGPRHREGVGRDAIRGDNERRWP